MTVTPCVWDRCAAGRWGWDISSKDVRVRQVEAEVLEGGASGMGLGSNRDLRAEDRHEELLPWLSTGLVPREGRQMGTEVTDPGSSYQAALWYDPTWWGVGRGCGNGRDLERIHLTL